MALDAPPEPPSRTISSLPSSRRAYASKSCRSAVAAGAHVGGAAQGHRQQRVAAGHDPGEPEITDIAAGENLVALGKRSVQIDDRPPSRLARQVERPVADAVDATGVGEADRARRVRIATFRHSRVNGKFHTSHSSRSEWGRGNVASGQRAYHAVGRPAQRAAAFAAVCSASQTAGSWLASVLYNSTSHRCFALDIAMRWTFR